MKRILAVAGLFLSAALIGCNSTGGGSSIIPLKAVGNVSGDMKGPQVFLLDNPMNGLMSVHGNFSYTILPYPPYLTYDGDFNFIIEPISGHEQEAIQAVTNGDVLIRRAGVVGGLNAVGTIRSFKAAMVASTLQREAAARAAADAAARDAAAKDAAKVPAPESKSPSPMTPSVAPPSPVAVAAALPEACDSDCPGGNCRLPLRVTVIYIPADGR